MTKAWKQALKYPRTSLKHSKTIHYTLEPSLVPHFVFGSAFHVDITYVVVQIIRRLHCHNIIFNILGKFPEQTLSEYKKNKIYTTPKYLSVAARIMCRVFWQEPSTRDFSSKLSPIIHYVKIQSTPLGVKSV